MGYIEAHSIHHWGCDGYPDEKYPTRIAICSWTSRSTVVLFDLRTNDMCNFSSSGVYNMTTFGPNFPSICPSVRSSFRYTSQPLRHLMFAPLQPDIRAEPRTSPESQHSSLGQLLQDLRSARLQSKTVEGYLDILGSTNSGSFKRIGWCFFF
ncbi:hypothetical protein L227DRAFT_354821 [Lentinus tigrinus ALCF2SS1-6]|uniref:Uncharacterized protein n=1 Tax=Lentinus tigrinus ALCF2SS1-6 TaxID=1328759 RepID=A0A5C2RUN3_9APHY|nr:hypothetical protein L227DRAFT_354821 [Lentinus tigrinus ALCF2SS1-6]